MFILSSAISCTSKCKPCWYNCSSYGLSIFSCFNLQEKSSDFSDLFPPRLLSCGAAKDLTENMQQPTAISTQNALRWTLLFLNFIFISNDILFSFYHSFIVYRHAILSKSITYGKMILSILKMPSRHSLCMLLWRWN